MARQQGWQLECILPFEVCSKGGLGVLENNAYWAIDDGKFVRMGISVGTKTPKQHTKTKFKVPISELRTCLIANLEEENKIECSCGKATTPPKRCICYPKVTHAKTKLI